MITSFNFGNLPNIKILYMCAAFALPMLRYILEHVTFAYIKTDWKTLYFTLFLLNLF